MNDKEVKEFMLQAYRTGDKEAAIILFCFRFLPSIMAALMLLGLFCTAVLLICIAIWGRAEPKPVTHSAPAQTIELEKSH